ncbi:DUF3231 family protein [Dethiobacter alkaliphilus]|uniref:DUF3231 family protein n=1 Tax=Dethiobacter alkaliphilus AHT 1 TaxID=555088 RepID=C0GJU2_DETAL|nr:DUF3231 family protein [Dethiobacter alkaliphilus]EEG76400.1 conserved hypothetical protein [Dethiobacter alkaliphilus AHT 1]
MLGLLGQKKQPTQVDFQEAYNLWDALSSRYDTIQQVQIWQNFVHDPDFHLLLKNSLMKVMDEQAKKIEELMDNYQLALPKRPPKSVRTPANTEAYEDRFIAGSIISMVQENVTQQLRFIRTSLTNDSLRSVFTNFLREEIELYDKALKYVKVKGWLGLPPMYKQVPPENKEYLDAGEASHIWDHLSSRYDSIDKTQKYHNFAHDVDFKAMLLLGLQKTLEKQVNILEKECNHFGISLPLRPPKSVNMTEGMELFEDESMYRDVFTGMQFMIELHATAIKQCTTNDRIRKIYIKFIEEELSTLNVWVKYGKVKGWLRPVPMYKVGNN